MGDDAALLDEYRSLRDAWGFDWGREFMHLPRDVALVVAGLVPGVQVSSRTLEELADELSRTTLPPGVALVDIDTGGAGVRLGVPMALPQGSLRPATVFVRNRSARPSVVTWGTQRRVVGFDETAVLYRTIVADDEVSLQVNGTIHSLAGLVFAGPSGRLRLGATVPRIWSVREVDGVDWFPAGASPHWDPRGSGWFIGSDVDLGLPEGDYEIRVGEAQSDEGRPFRVEVVRDSTIEFSYAEGREIPSRRSSLNSPMWTTADLHVHRNYSGTDVVDLGQAQAMQDAAEVGVMALVAGNVHTSRVYDSSLRNRCPAETPGGRLTVFGTEFRNDFYGHLVVLGATPSHVYSGHELSDHPVDDITPLAVAKEARAGGGVAIVAHPFWGPLEHDLPAVSVERLRSLESAYLPVLATLDAVDAVELLSPGHTATAEQVVHRLLDLGARFALTAGSDTFMSFAAGPTSRPPGNVRCRLGIRGALNGGTVLDAIKRRETCVERRISAVVRFFRGDDEIRLGQHAGSGDVPLTVDIESPMDSNVRFELRSAGDRVWPVSLREGRYRGELPSDAVTWVAVRATAADDADAYFHTTPVFLEDEDEAARDSAARWALAWIDQLELRVSRFGRGSPSILQTVFDELAQAVDVCNRRLKGKR